MLDLPLPPGVSANSIPIRHFALPPSRFSLLSHSADLILLFALVGYAGFIVSSHCLPFLPVFLRFTILRLVGRTV